MMQHKYFLVLDYVRNDFKAVLKFMSNVNKTFPSYENFEFSAV